MPIWEQFQYDSVPSKELEVPASHGSEALPLHPKGISNKRISSVVHLLMGLLAATVVILGVVLIALVQRLQIAQNHLLSSPSFASGWGTEFQPAFSTIEVVETTFVGGLAYNDEGHPMVPHKPPIKYAGIPSPEIDAAWEDLTAGRYFLVTEEEIKAHFPDDYRDYWNAEVGGYYVGLDVFHTLHCLNMVRKALTPEYYSGMSSPPGNERKPHLHLDHCIEQIRQYLMCVGDLTPIPTRYMPGIHNNYAVSDLPHTCRNWDPIRKWVQERHNGSTAVPPMAVQPS